MKNLKIRSKLLLTFMLVIILFCGTVAIAIAGLQENEDKYSEFYNVEYQITNKVMSMRRGLQIIVKDLSFLTIEKDASRRNSYLSDLQKELNSLSENATWLMANFTGDQELLNLFAAEIQEAIALQETIISTTETDMVNAQDTIGEGFPLFLFHSGGMSYEDYVEIELEWFCQSPLKLLNPEGGEIPYQRIHTDAKIRHTTLGGRRRFVFYASVPANGFVQYRVVKEEPSLESTPCMEILNSDALRLENVYLLAEFDGKQVCYLP